MYFNLLAGKVPSFSSVNPPSEELSPVLSSFSSDVKNHSAEEDDLKDALFFAELSLCCSCAVLLSSTFKQNYKIIHYRHITSAIIQVSLGLVQAPGP